MTAEQRAALQDYVLYAQASTLLDRKAELEFCRVPVNRPRVDAIQAIAADVHEASERAFDALLKTFGV